MRNPTIYSATMRTPFPVSCAPAKHTGQYQTQSCQKCHTGTLEILFDTQLSEHYASCLNCGTQFYASIPQAI